MYPQVQLVRLWSQLNFQTQFQAAGTDSAQYRRGRTKNFLIGKYICFEQLYSEIHGILTSYNKAKILTSFCENEET